MERLHSELEQLRGSCSAQEATLAEAQAAYDDLTVRYALVCILSVLDTQLSIHRPQPWRSPANLMHMLGHADKTLRSTAQALHIHICACVGSCSACDCTADSTGHAQGRQLRLCMCAEVHPQSKRPGSRATRCTLRPASAWSLTTPPCRLTSSRQAPTPHLAHGSPDEHCLLVSLSQAPAHAQIWLLRCQMCLAAWDMDVMWHSQDI